MAPLISSVLLLSFLQSLHSFSLGSYGTFTRSSRFDAVRRVENIRKSSVAYAATITPEESSPHAETGSDVIEAQQKVLRNLKTTQERERLKSRLFAKSAACDRGFGASIKDREDIASIVEELSALSPEKVPTRGLSPFRTAVKGSEMNEMALATEAPVVGAWQMIYTTAFDVLSLAASPLTLLQGIYQVIYADGTSVNVIDLAPRIQVILPVQLQTERNLTSTLRARVFTTAKARSDDRIGLTFKRVAVSAFKFLSFDVSKFPKFGVTFPTASTIGAGSDTTDNDPGYFDILYVDNDCLIIKQNAPGGIFVNIRSEEPMSSFLE